MTDDRVCSMTRDDGQWACTRPAQWRVTFTCPEDSTVYTRGMCDGHMLLTDSVGAVCSLHGRHHHIEKERV